MVAEQVQDFDVEKAIASFLVDPARLSLELPHMTTGQRKHVRRVVDQHIGQLRCESYGFGAERRLHVFKEAAPPLAFGEFSPPAPQDKAAGLRVKNTFIDGLDEDASDPVIFRSMPGSAQLASLTLSKIHEAACNSETHSPGRSSTSASGDNTGDSGSASASAEGDSGFGESFSGERDVPLLPQGCSVRNTFIHIAGEEEADSPEHVRVVQSMPHGMFRQSLQDEISAVHQAQPTSPIQMMPTTPTLAEMSSYLHTPSFSPTDFNVFSVAPPAPSNYMLPPSAQQQALYIQGLHCMDPSMSYPPPPMQAAAITQLPPATAVGNAEAVAAFPPGSEVVIDGLLKAPQFNGKKGVVQSLDTETGRYSILLTEGTSQWAKVQGKNLRLAVPPPPPTFAAAPLLVEDPSQQQVLTFMQQPTDVTGPTAASTPVLQLTALV
jgi:hypothetical protein